MNIDKYKKFLDATWLKNNDEYNDGYELGLSRFYEGNIKEIESSIISKWSEEYSAGFKAGDAGKPAKGVDGRIGNFNASKANLDTAISLRMNSDDKKAFEAIALSEGKSLASWIMEACKDKQKRS